MKKISLKPYEARILKVLEPKATTETIAKKSNLSTETVNTVCESMRDKELVKIKSTPKKLVELTTEGEGYAKFGLPERRILRAISKGVTLADLSTKLNLSQDKVKIGIGWLMKKNCIQIKETVQLTDKGKKALKEKWDEEKVLERIAKEQPVSVAKLDRNLVELLKNRNLIRVIKRSSKLVSLTQRGKDVLKGKIKFEKKLTKLSSDLILTGKWKKFKLAEYDVSLPSYEIYPGKKHFMRQVLEYIRKIWIEMGFEEMEGPILETAFWDYDALYVPQDHPARELQDTFYMKFPEKGRLPKKPKKLVRRVKLTHENGWTTGSTGWKYKWDKEIGRRCLLRTHTTSLSARTLAKLGKDLKEGDLPAKYFSVGRCFRNETPDWKHLAEFYQTEGIVVGDVNFRHMLGYLKRYLAKLGFEKARFRPGYFPYTEFSLQVEVFHPRYKKWMELVGAGIFRPEVVKPLLGKAIPVLAWGSGFERLVMPHYQITDIRELYSSDLKLLREAKLWVK